LAVKVERLPSTRSLRLTVGDKSIDIDGIDDIRTAIVRFEELFDEIICEIKNGRNARK
jgi:hypothetical protein